MMQLITSILPFFISFLCVCLLVASPIIIIIIITYDTINHEPLTIIYHRYHHLPSTIYHMSSPTNPPTHPLTHPPIIHHPSFTGHAYMDIDDVDRAILAYQHSLQLHPTSKVTPFPQDVSPTHPHTPSGHVSYKPSHANTPCNFTLPPW